MNYKSPRQLYYFTSTIMSQNSKYIANCGHGLYIYLFIAARDNIFIDRVSYPANMEIAFLPSSGIMYMLCCVSQIPVPFVHPTKLKIFIAIGVLRNRTLYLGIHNSHRTRAKFGNPQALQRMTWHLGTNAFGTSNTIAFM